MPIRRRVCQHSVVARYRHRISHRLCFFGRISSGRDYVLRRVSSSLPTFQKRDKADIAAPAQDDLVDGCCLGVGLRSVRLLFRRPVRLSLRLRLCLSSTLQERVRVRPMLSTAASARCEPFLTRPAPPLEQLGRLDLRTPQFRSVRQPDEQGRRRRSPRCRSGSTRALSPSLARTASRPHHPVSHVFAYGFCVFLPRVITPLSSRPSHSCRTSRVCRYTLPKTYSRWPPGAV